MKVAHISPYSTQLTLLADKIKIQATQFFFTVILIVIQNCVFGTDAQGTTMNIILYTRRLSSLAQSLKEHGKFSGDTEAAVTSYTSVLLTLQRGVTSPARHAARSHSFVYISTS